MSPLEETPWAQVSSSPAQALAFAGCRVSDGRRNSAAG